MPRSLVVASVLTSVVPPSSWITPSPAPEGCAAVAPVIVSCAPKTSKPDAGEPAAPPICQGALPVQVASMSLSTHPPSLSESGPATAKVPSPVTLR